jgi:hypothetical protein
MVDTRTGVGGFGVLHWRVERRMTWERVGISWVGLEGKCKGGWGRTSGQF